MNSSCRDLTDGRSVIEDVEATQDTVSQALTAPQDTALHLTTLCPHGPGTQIRMPA